MSRILQVDGDEGWQFYVVLELLDVIAEEILIVWVSYRNSSAKKMKLCLYLPKFNLWYPEPLDNKNLALKNNLCCWFYLKNWIGCVCLFFSLHLAWRNILVFSEWSPGSLEWKRFHVVHQKLSWMDGLEASRETAKKCLGDQFHMMLLPNLKHKNFLGSPVANTPCFHC